LVARRNLPSRKRLDDKTSAPNVWPTLDARELKTKSKLVRSGSNKNGVLFLGT
jgi:hypothetical protein